jgi:hypothetical protein
MAFSASSSKNLGLDDILFAGELLGDGFRVLRVGRDSELLNGDVKFLEQSLGLILQKIQVTARNLKVCRLGASQEES